MSFETWLLFCSASVLVILVPGPLSLLMVANSLNYGIKRSYPAFLGGVSASLLLLIASATGLGALLLASEQLFSLLKYAGAAYLIYLGYRSWCEAQRHRNAESENKNNPNTTQISTISPGFRSLFWRAFGLGISNPKDILFFVAFLPQFISAELPFTQQLLVMVASWTVLDLGCKLIYGGSAKLVAPALQSHRGQKIFNRFCGGLFISTGASAMILK
ncbi:LysE family translocator [Motiliproteus sp. MSK22-1]|uniref:LysE family translocator n=1 Tax=Motiliproteus sp. MSK22-1 TaxID=1897630 RepID=UPI000977EAF1|nr:LysE family translocator [Motiliproteus sp. MSK22-1]OMH39794.1 lysine transporter LysE [Motiliproteus sp. MSK22-1]